MSASSLHFTLDSYALLAYFEGEKGKSHIEKLLYSAESGKCVLHLSMINLGEVLYITERERGRITAIRTLAAIDQLPLHIEPVSRTLMLAAAHLKASNAISYADAFAAATAQEFDCVLLTGDPEFRTLARAGFIKVEWLKQ